MKFMKNQFIKTVIFICIVPFICFIAQAKTTEISFDKNCPPIAFGVSDLRTALDKVKAENVHIFVTTNLQSSESSVVKQSADLLPCKAESFVISRLSNEIGIVGRDNVGLMYGCFELAERLQMEGKKVLEFKEPVVQSPFVEFRAINPFLTLPYDKSTMETWWFVQNDFWQDYLDMLARSRINWIDYHGMYNIKKTDFPNLYPYFIKSDMFPKAGVDSKTSERNLAMLKKVMKMAKERGIKFSLMSYSTYFGPYCNSGPYDWNDQKNHEKYTKECVTKIIQACPDLDMIGFRVGESGQSDEFYLNSYIPAIKECGRDIDIYVRSWGAEKTKIVEMGKAFPGRFAAEVKYNGEQYGPPYIVAGGKMASWRDYSYQNYFSSPDPYRVIFQIRVNGTHRVFPWGCPDLVSVSARNCVIGGAEGFCVEPINSYYPKYNYHARERTAGTWYKWVYQRDWMFYNVWGRMSYNPDLSEQVWIEKFKQRFGGKVGEPLYRAFATSGRIIPRCFTFFGIHPDHRGHAPELETGGPVTLWASEPAQFDEQNYQNPREFVQRIVKKDPSARFNPMQAANLLDRLAGDTMQYLHQAKKIGCTTNSKEFISLGVDMEMLVNIARYNAARLRSATYFSLYEIGGDPEVAKECRLHHKKAIEYWNKLAELGQANYKPFVDTLRMHTEKFTWKDQAVKNDHAWTVKIASGEYPLANHLKPLDDLERQNLKPKGLSSDILKPKGDKKGPVINIPEEKLSSSINGIKKLTVAAKITDPAGISKVYLKWKPFPSESTWRRKKMSLNNGRFSATLDVYPYGIMWCIEALDKDGNGSMWPDFRNDIPYRWINPWFDKTSFVEDMEKAVDQIYNDPTKYKAVFIGRRAEAFNYAKKEIKTKLLKAVKKGMLLYIDGQNYKFFDLSWLPGKISAKNRNANKVKLVPDNKIFDGLGPEISNRHIASAVFTADKNWQLLGEPKAVALRKYGKGIIIINQIQQFERPIGWTSYGNLEQMTRYLLNIISLSPNKRNNLSVLVLDQGEGTIIDILASVNERATMCNISQKEFKKVKKLVETEKQKLEQEQRILVKARKDYMHKLKNMKGFYFVDAAEMQGDWKCQTHYKGFFGKGFRTKKNPKIDDKSKLKTILNIKKSNVYDVWVHGLIGPGQRNRQFSVSVGDKTFDSTHTEPGPAGGKFVWQKAGQVRLSSGKTEVIIRDTGSGYESPDAIVLTDDLDWKPKED